MKNTSLFKTIPNVKVYIKKKRKKKKKLDLIGDKHKLLMSNQPSDSAYYDNITPSGVEFHYIMSCIYLKQERGNIYRVIAVIMSIHSNLRSNFLHVMSLY